MTESARNAILDSWTRSTSKDVCDWFAAQKPKTELILNYGRNDVDVTASAIDEVRKTHVANMEVIEHDIRYALHPYGRVSNIEMETYLDDVTTTMRVDFDVTCGFFSFNHIRDAILKLPWIHKVVNCYYIPSTKSLTMTIEFNMFMYNERRKEVMGHENSATNYYLKAVGVFVPQIDRVTFNGPATIVFWTDGTKTIVKCMEDEEFDPEKGLAMAICKRLYGGKFHKTFKDAIKNAKW